MIIVVLALILGVLLGVLILIPRGRKSGKLLCLFTFSLSFSLPTHFNKNATLLSSECICTSCLIWGGKFTAGHSKKVDSNASNKKVNTW
jgi:hypothetical protein